MLDDNEVILKRINRKLPNCIHDQPGWGPRATKFSLSPRDTDTDGPSWSRLAVTSPQELSDLAARQGLDPDDYTICYTTVKCVRDLGLDVMASETSDDPGHCHIAPTPQQEFTKKVWSKLAKKTRILTDLQIASMSAGEDSCQLLLASL